MHSERAYRRRGYIRMKSSSQYREFAEECHQLAQQAKDQRHRKILDEMAEVWNKLAEEADKKDGSPIQTFP